MAWKDDEQGPMPPSTWKESERASPGKAPGAGRAARSRHGEAPERPPRGWARSEQPVITDGQLKGAMERGPERANPEGSVDISNDDYRE